MVSKLKILKIVYPDIQMYQRDAAKLRGFFANKHEDDDIFHNHLGHTFRYEYPKIQYKALYGKPTIIAFGLGIPAAYKSVLEENEIDIGGETIHVAGMRIDMYETKVGDCDSILTYRFVSPWLALNQKNYTAYRQRKTIDDKKALLENILIGNILSMFKSLQIRLENKIAVSAKLSEIPVNFKNESMLGFYGKFTVNCRLPSYFGIGKSVSRGFGTIVRIKTPKNPEKAGEEDVEGV